MAPNSSGTNMIVLPKAQPAQPISVVENSNPSAPISAAVTASPRSTRRNQYMARPAPTSLSAVISVSAGAAGSSHASHVSGKSSAVCGLAKNGAPVYACGTQSGKRPAWISLPLHSSAG